MLHSFEQGFEPFKCSSEQFLNTFTAFSFSFTFVMYTNVNINHIFILFFIFSFIIFIIIIIGISGNEKMRSHTFVYGRMIFFAGYSSV